MSDRRETWIRLSDVRVPRVLPYSYITALAVVRWQERKAMRKLGKSMAEVGSLVGQRWYESDERERQLLALTRQLTRLTGVLVVLTVAVVAVTVWTVLHASP